MAEPFDDVVDKRVVAPPFNAAHLPKNGRSDAPALRRDLTERTPLNRMRNIGSRRIRDPCRQGLAVGLFGARAHLGSGLVLWKLDSDLTVIGYQIV